MLDAYDLLFVHRANDISRRDVAIACELAALVGADLRAFDVVEDTGLKRRPRFIKRMNIRRRMAMGCCRADRTRNDAGSRFARRFRAGV